MGIARVSHLLLLAASMAFAAPPDAPVVPIRFPAPAVVPTPTPPGPGVVTRLDSGVLYVVDSDIDVMADAFPDGLLKVTVSDGPLSVYGKFVDGTGKTELRKFSGKKVVIVEAVGAGRASLVLVPVGAKSRAEWLTRNIDANTAPIPPPAPEPTPPTPPTPPQPVTSFRVIFVHESGATLPLGQQSVMDAKAVRDYLAANTTPDGGYQGWRRYDKDVIATNETPAIKALWEAAKPKITTVPSIVVSVNGGCEIVPWPASPADAVALLKKYNGGK